MEKKKPSYLTGGNATKLRFREPMQLTDEGVMEIHISDEERRELEDEEMEEIPEPRVKSVVRKVVHELPKPQEKPRSRSEIASQLLKELVIKLEQGKRPLTEEQCTGEMARFMDVLNTPHPTGKHYRSIEITLLDMLDLESKINMGFAMGCFTPDQMESSGIQGMVRSYRKRLLLTYVDAVKEMRGLILDLNMKMLPHKDERHHISMCRTAVWSQEDQRQKVYEQFIWLQDLASRCGTIAGQYGSGKRVRNGFPLWGDLRTLWKGNGESFFQMKETISSVGGNHQDIHLFSVTDKKSKEVMSMALCPSGIGELVLQNGVCEQILMGRMVLQKKGANQKKGHVNESFPLEASWNFAYVRLPLDTYEEGKVSKSLPLLGTFRLLNLQKNGINIEPYKSIYLEKRDQRPSREEEENFFLEAVFA